MPFQIKVMKTYYILVLHHAPAMVIKLIVINVTGYTIVPWLCKNVRHAAVAFFSPYMTQRFPFVKNSNKKGNKAYTQANYDTKSQCIHKTLHFE